MAIFPMTAPAPVALAGRRLRQDVRDALKSKIRSHPHIMAHGIRVQGHKDELLGWAEALSIPIPSPFDAVPVDVEDDAAPAAEAPAPAAAPAPATEAPAALDVDTAVSDVLAPLGSGDFGEFRTKLRALAERAATPIVVERVERVEVEVERYAGANAPSHVPAIVGTEPAGKLLGIKGAGASIPLSIWDAPDAPAVDDHYIWPDSTGMILTQLRRGRNVLLWGPAGTGKTTFAEQLAARTKRPCVRISCTEQTDAAVLVGMTVTAGGGTWRDGVLTRAIRRPGTIVLIDEPSVARPGALFVFQSLMDGSRSITIEETGEVVKVARGVTIILADNTPGVGDETGAYEGTRRLNRATLDRLGITVHLDYLPADREALALMARTGAPRALCNLAVQYANLTRHGVTAGKLTHGLGFRRLTALVELWADGIAPDVAYDAAIHHTAAPDDREHLRQLYKAAIPPDAIQRALA